MDPGTLQPSEPLTTYFPVTCTSTRRLAYVSLVFVSYAFREMVSTYVKRSGCHSEGLSKALPPFRLPASTAFGFWRRPPKQTSTSSGPSWSWRTRSWPRRPAGTVSKSRTGSHRRNRLTTPAASVARARQPPSPPAPGRGRLVCDAEVLTGTGVPAAALRYCPLGGREMLGRIDCPRAARACPRYGRARGYIRASQEWASAALAERAHAAHGRGPLSVLAL